MELVILNIEYQQEKVKSQVNVKQKRKEPPKKTKDKIHAYLFVLPAIFFFFLLIAYPLVTVIWDSFQFKSLLNAAQSTFAGLENYRTVLKSENFTNAFSNTVIWTVLSVAGEFLLGLVSAVALNQHVKGRAIFRGIIIIPWVVPIVIAGMTWTWMLTPDYGIINLLLTKVGIIDKPYYWLGEKNSALLTVTFVNIWRAFPYYTICFLAALQAIPKELFEAVRNRRRGDDETLL